MITVYIYYLNTGCFIQVEKGSIECIMSTLDPDKDFTLTPPPDYAHQWRWVDTEWVADAAIQTPVAELQDTAWSNIKSKRSELLVSGVLVESVGKVFQTDNDSMIQYSNIAGMIALDNYSPIEWKTEDNTFILLTVDLFKELQKAITINTQRIFKAAEDHREAMLLLEDPLEYYYLTNW